MKKIYLVRHGETNDNANKIVQDGNSVLSHKGHLQAEKLVSRLENLSFQNLIVSDYVRTRQTAEYLLKKVKIIPDYSPLVRETKQPTSMLGVSNESEKFLEYYQQVGENLDNPSWRHSDEETFYDVVERVKLFFKHIDTLDGDTLVVSHGRFIIYVVMSVLSGGDLKYDTWEKCRHGFETTNTGITTLIFNEKFKSWKLLVFNDQAHFAE